MREWLTVAWRLLWYIPFHVLVALHVGVVMLVYGRKHASGLWDEWRMQ